MSGDVRRDEEQATQRRSGVLHMTYVDTTVNTKLLFKNILSVAEMRSLRIVPLVADEHNINFGVTTTTSKQTLQQLASRFLDQHTTFSLISESGFDDYM